MAVKCLKCTKTVRKNQHALECDSCKGWTHRTCETGMSRDYYLQLVESNEDFDFKCHLCSTPEHSDSSMEIEVGQFSVMLETSADEPPVDMSDLQVSCGSIEDIEDIAERSMVLSMDEESEEPDDTPDYTYLATGSQKGKPLLISHSGYTYVQKKAYRTNQNIHRFIKKLMALAFLPPSHIRPVFRQLQTKATTRGMKSLCEYFSRQWLDHSTFTVSSWSVFNQSVRTNNHVEGWNRRINSRNGERTFGLYKLVPALLKEAKQVNLQARLLDDGKLKRHVRKTASRSQEEIFAAWRLYKEGNISPTELLWICSQLTGPVE